MKRVAIILTGAVIAASAALVYNTMRREEPQEQQMIRPEGRSFKVETLGSAQKRDQYSIYGYLPYWMLSEIENIRFDLLSDIAYFGVEIDSTGSIVKEKVDEEDNLMPHAGYYAWRNDPRLTEAFRVAEERGVKTALTVISHNDEVSEDFLRCRYCWENFYQELQVELAYRNTKNININFENYRPVPEEVSNLFAEFIAFLKNRIKRDIPEGQLVVTAFADSIINQRMTDIPSIADIPDKIFIMAYDFHITPEDKASPISPLGGAGIHAQYDIRTMIKDYLSYIPPQRLILGVPYYGFDWTRQIHELEDTDPEKETVDLPEESLVDDGDENEEENEDESISFSSSITQTYAQIMSNLESLDIEPSWDELGQVPFYEYPDPNSEEPRKVYFENTKSLEIKYKIAKEFNLDGIGIWALGYDGARPELWELIEEEFPLVLD